MAEKRMAEKKRWLNLKMKFLLIVLVPVLCTFLAIGIYSHVRLDKFGQRVVSQSTDIVTNMAEERIISKAAAVASEMELALQLYPHLSPEEFNNNPGIKAIGAQTVGQNGYTLIWQKPQNGSEVSPVWIHPASWIIGTDSVELLKKRLGEHYPEWYRLYDGCRRGNPTHGYYLWEEEKGKWLPKFLACNPIGDTGFVVSATTYLDEFLVPVKTVENDVTSEMSHISIVYFTTMGLGLAAFICCVFVGIQRISRHIIGLTRAIEDVSLGKVDNKVEIIPSNDELQDLSEAFERMRVSVKFMMKKLNALRQQGD